MMIIYSGENVLGNFTQLDKDFDVQERNWIRWAGGKSYLNHLYWNGCMTGRLEQSCIESSESATESRDQIAKLDAYQFDKLVTWLPKQFKSVYVAHVFNKAVLSGKVKTTRAGDRAHQCDLLGITKYRYDQLLESAIKMIMREGKLA